MVRVVISMVKSDSPSLKLFIRQYCSDVEGDSLPEPGGELMTPRMVGERTAWWRG